MTEPTWMQGMQFSIVMWTSWATLFSASLSAQTYYDDVRPVLAANCQRCHSDGGVGWSMADAEETYEHRRDIARVVARKIMPPWLAETGHQAYRGDVSLDQETVDLIARWADRGFAKGERRPDIEVSEAVSFLADLSFPVLPAEGYLPDQELADEYRCFVVDWTPESPKYVTGFRAVPGNHTVVHHLVAYSVAPSMADRFLELADEEEGGGYRCFGGAIPDRLGGGQARAEYESRFPDGVRQLLRNQSWLAHWAPGMDGHRFPEGTGILMKPGMAIVVQIHYYTPDAPGQEDQGTRMDFQIADQVDQPAFYFAQTDNEWLSGKRTTPLVVPAGEQATFSVTYDLESLVPTASSMTGVPRDEIEGFTVHSANLHMHAFGHSGEISMDHASGQKEVLLSVPRWNLAWQRDFTFENPKVLARDALASTRIALTCTFENRTDNTVYGGLGSYDEMCFNFSYIAVQSQGDGGNE